MAGRRRRWRIFSRARRRVTQIGSPALKRVWRSLRDVCCALHSWPMLRDDDEVQARKIANRSRDMPAIVIASEAKRSSSLSKPPGDFRRGACHRAGHFGPDPLAPRNDEHSRDAFRARALPPPRPKRIRPRQKRGRRSAERRMPTIVRAAPANVAACRCPGAAARQFGARSPSGASPRLSPGLSHPGAAPGHASWDLVPAGVTRRLLSQSSGSTPRLGRSTEENDAQSRSGAGLRARAEAPHSLHTSEFTSGNASLNEQDSSCIRFSDECQDRRRSGDVALTAAGMRARNRRAPSRTP